DVGLACDCAERWYPIVMAHDLIANSAWFDDPWPPDQARHAKSTLPIGIFLGPEPRHRSIGPCVHMGSIVAAIYDEGVVGDPHIVECLEQIPDEIVVLLHTIDILAVAVLIATPMFGANVRP